MPFPLEYGMVEMPIRLPLPYLGRDGPRQPVLIPGYPVESPEELLNNKNDQPCLSAHLWSATSKDTDSVSVGWGLGAVSIFESFPGDSTVQPGFWASFSLEFTT